ncbi:MAG TPA: hypothetical protein VJ953_04025 [Saprospiraceae bacterium]|nr:hypothetical protein [Saprospiraceae bacterium]
MKKLAVFIAMTCLFSSCLISLHPLYTEETIVYEPLLAGEWLEVTDPSTTSTWIFRPKKSSIGVQTSENDRMAGHYELAHFSGSSNYIYNAVLLKLGGTYFLDVFPESSIQGLENYLEKSPESAGLDFLKSNDEQENYPELANYVPSHNFYKVEFCEDQQVCIYPFNGDRLQELVEQRKIRIKHEQVHDNFIITASTQDLQRFIAKYAEDMANFEEPLIMNLQ